MDQNISNSEPYVDCYIFEVMQWPRYGEHYNYYVLNDIFYFNSLIGASPDKANSRYMKIPEHYILNAEMEKVLEQKDRIIGKPVIRKINEQNWTFDTLIIDQEII